MKRWSDDRMDEFKAEALDFYRENSFGYKSVEQYVLIDFGHMVDAEQRAEIAQYIRENL